MKTLSIALLALVVFGCGKPQVVETKLDPNKKYYMEYQTSDQQAKMSVSNDTLRINFQQNVVFLVDPNDYAHTWAIHLIQDFSQSHLHDLHYNALASAAGYSYDWVPINLNDVYPGQKTATNVNVNGKNYVKITVSRVFEFFSKMGSAQAAVNQQNALLQTTNNTVTYKAFYSDGTGYSISNDGTFKIVYSNQ